MRTLRLSVAWAAIVVLIGGVATVGLAEDQAAGGPVAHVTGTIVDTSYDDSMATATTAPGDIHHVEGASYVETNAWDDPRLPVGVAPVPWTPTLDGTTPQEGVRWGHQGALATIRRSSRPRP